MKITNLDDRFDALRTLPCFATECELPLADIFEQIVAFASGTPIDVVDPGALHGARRRTG